MALIEKLNLGTIESISKVLGHTETGFTGTQIGKLLSECDIDDVEPMNTKWKRLDAALTNKQSIDKCANNVIGFIQHALNPVRLYNREEWFNDTRAEINKILGFESLLLGEDGKIERSKKVTTISESVARASKLKEHLVIRKIHPDVMKYCREELLVDNYFHVVFEATKSVADKIRIKTGLQLDGSPLVDEAFAFKGKIPHLALNALESESEKSEQRGVMNLLKGLFGTFRNTTAHAPKIKWKIEEQDALDILSLISLVHRRLDHAIEARKMYEGKM